MGEPQDCDLNREQTLNPLSPPGTYVPYLGSIYLVRGAVLGPGGNSSEQSIRTLACVELPFPAGEESMNETQSSLWSVGYGEGKTERGGVSF